MEIQPAVIHKRHHLKKYIPILLLLLPTILSCSMAEEEKEKMNDSPIIFLGSRTCRNSPLMLENLNHALQHRQLQTAIEIIEVGSLAVDDYRRGYGVPTILVNGSDLFGMPTPLPSSAEPG